MSALCGIGKDALYVIVTFCEIVFFFLLGFTELSFLCTILLSLMYYFVTTGTKCKQSI
jgi:hypothetical protein